MSDLDTSLTALRDDAALVSPDSRFLVRAAGPDLLPWLERLCSMPVQDIAPDQVRRATLMDGKGKLRCDLRVLSPASEARDPQTPSLLLDLPSSTHANMLRLLDMFIIKEKVELTDLFTERVHLALLGPRAGEVLAACELPGVPEAGALVELNPGVLALPENLSGTGGVELFVERESARELVDALLARGATRVDNEALEITRLEHGIPRFDKDLADGVIPLEAQLEDWVSTTKGCYPGQEVVARIRNLGQVGRKLVRLQAEGEHALSADSELLGCGESDGKTAGSLSSWVVDPAGSRTLALAYVRRAFWNSGTQLRVGDVPFTVHDLAAS
ncbi:MAG: glycine cleavage system protein T [Planctomycetota bacterium]|nr:MAG: glycine cleavage system protein T [Planctomycetota bacterium]